jgi:hypothetical protein
MSSAIAEQNTRALTTDEQVDLERLERVIDGGRKAFVEVGRALMEIRERRLYRATYETFESYVQEKWDFGRAYASRLIGAHETMEHLLPIGNIPLPANESHVRPLLRFPPEHRAEVWRDILKRLPVDDNGEKVILAKDIEREVKFGIRAGDLESYKAYRREQKKREHRKPPPKRESLADTEEDRAAWRVVRAEADTPTCPNCSGTEFDEDGDCARCREPGAGTPAVKNTDPPKVRGVGIIRANEAINALCRIPRGDALRKDAWQMVRDWLDHNE